MSLNHSFDSTPTLLVELSLLQSHACLSWIHSEHVLFLLHTHDILSLIVNPFSSLALQIPLLGYLHGFEKFGPVFYNVTAMVSKPVFFDLDPVDFKLKMLLTFEISTIHSCKWTPVKCRAVYISGPALLQVGPQCEKD